MALVFQIQILMYQIICVWYRLNKGARGTMSTFGRIALAAAAFGGALHLVPAIAAEGDTLVIQVPIDPGSLDPQTSVGSWGRLVSRFAYDTLVGEGPKGEILPQLAESWQATPTEFSFTLRDDVTCADGSKLTASMVAANFERLKKPETKAPYAASFMSTLDYTVEADDAARKLVIKLPSPFSPLLSNLTTYPQIICKAGLDNAAELPTKTYGTGPWVLTSATPGDSFEFKLREDYKWGPDGATVDAAAMPGKVVVKVVANETTAANLLLSGGLDIARFVTPAGDRLTEQQANLVLVPTVNTSLQFNFLREGNLLRSKAVRKALVGYLNRDELSMVATGKQQVSNSVALPQAVCGDALTGEMIVKHDPAAADAALQAEGWAKNADGLWAKDGKTLAVKFLVTGSAGDPNRAAGAFVYDVWRKSGIDASIQTADEKAGMDIRKSGDWDVLLVGWNGVFNPAIISPFYTSPTSAVYTFLDNQKYNDLAKQAYAAAPDQACSFWNRAQAAIDEEVSVVPMYYTVTKFASAKAVDFATERSFISPHTIRVEGK